jgi:phage anti-repressor protein
MKDLILVASEAINGDQVQTVNARELHGFLKVGRDFSNWIKARIEKYGFLENEDYVVFAGSGENPQAGRPTTDYHISIDMAKELSMVENNDQGREARQYFIRCEKQAKAQVAPIQDPQLAAMVMALTQIDQVKQEQSSQRLELENLKAKMTASPEQFYTVAGYASLRGINVDVKRANALGRKATKLSKENELETGTAHSSIFGTVKTYHVDILCEVFSTLL